MVMKCFKYNQHFVAMMNIINMSRLNPPESGHKHHIIPKCWFRMNSLPIDNSKGNIVLLSYENHVKIHKLMSLCSITQELSQKMICAYNMLMKGTVLGISYKHTQDTKNKISESHKGKHLTEETRRKMSESLKGRPPTKGSTGMHWYNNGIVNKYTYECPEGFVKGMLNHG